MPFGVCRFGEGVGKYWCLVQKTGDGSELAFLDPAIILLLFGTWTPGERWQLTAFKKYS